MYNSEYFSNGPCNIKTQEIMAIHDFFSFVTLIKSCSLTLPILPFFYKSFSSLSLLIIYSCFNSKPDFDKLKLVVYLKNNTQSVVKWGKTWLVNFNAPKMELLSFNRARESFLPSVNMVDANFRFSFTAW